LLAERGRTAVETEKLRLAQQLQEAAIEAETPVKKLRLEHMSEILKAELAVKRIENDVKALAAEGEAIYERVRQTLRREILPLEQAPAIAESLSKALQGAQLSVYGSDAQFVAPFSMLLDLLAARLDIGRAGHTPGSAA
jgi:hypothetical protein